MSDLRLLWDADILIKLAVLDCFTYALAALGVKHAETATMCSMTRSAGIANAQVRLTRAGSPKGAGRLFEVLRNIRCIDKLSEEERSLAAQIVEVSQREALAVDGGEALLIAVAAVRGIPLLATSDKRAIRSLPALAVHLAQVQAIAGNVIPLELVVFLIIRKFGLAALHAKLEAGKACDTSIANALAATGADQALLEQELSGRLAKLAEGAPGFVALNYVSA